jgi:antirestriction protein ArdC
VNAGAKAIYIIVPIFRKKSQEADEPEQKTENEEDKKINVRRSEISGFRAMPVFRVEDTSGEPLPYELKVASFDVSRLPLIDVAESFGVSVKAGATFSYSGVYRPTVKEIILGTDNPQTFLHELSHAVDYALPDRDSEYCFSEIVAELSSAFLGSLLGVNVDLASTKAYIELYSGKEHVAFKIMEALGRVEQIYHYIELHTKAKRRGKSSQTLCDKKKSIYVDTLFAA